MFISSFHMTSKLVTICFSSLYHIKHGIRVPSVSYGWNKLIHIVVQDLLETHSRLWKHPVFCKCLRTCAALDYRRS